MSSTSSSSFFFEKVNLFHAQLGFDICPEMKSLHTSLNPAHSGCKLSSFMSLFTHSLKIFLPLPTHLSPATSTFIQAETQSSPLLCSRCPNHLNLPRHVIMRFYIISIIINLSTPKSITQPSIIQRYDLSWRRFKRNKQYLLVSFCCRLKSQ